jgi:hypothetical protein
MGSHEEGPQDELLRRAQEAIDAASELVAHSQVIVELSEDLREAELTSRCAWCGRYHLADRWVILRLALRVREQQTTHGICPDCLGALREAGLSA